MEDQPLSASGRKPLSEAGRAEAELARLTSQINRLCPSCRQCFAVSLIELSDLERYSGVARDLDTGARAVWDELYALFQDIRC